MNNFEIITLNKIHITDFAKERNNLLEKSKNDWILYLDQDEVLSKSISQSFNNSVKSYYIYRKNYFLEKYIGSEKIIRLVKRGTGQWVRKVHEVWTTKEKVGEIKNNYIVHNTAKNLHDYIEKINNYSDLHALANREEGKKSSLFKIIFFPIGKFVVTLIKSKNVVFSIMQSLHSFLSWTKLYFLTE
jgi:hypothetical protein